MNLSVVSSLRISSHGLPDNFRRRFGFHERRESDVALDVRGSINAKRLR